MRTRENISTKKSALARSAADLRVFDLKFKPAVIRYRQWQRRWWGGWLLMIPAVLISPLVFTNHPEYGIVAICVVLLVQIVTVFFRPTLLCPACTQELEATFGAYCPRCGRSGLVSAAMRDFPHCAACGDLSLGKFGRHYKVRHCSSCGLSVDKEGI